MQNRRIKSTTLYRGVNQSDATSSLAKLRADSIVATHCERSSQIACLIHLCDSALSQFEQSSSIDLQPLRDLHLRCVDAYIKLNNLCDDCVQSALEAMQAAHPPQTDPTHH